MRLYRLMQAWSANERFDFEFYNAHDLNTARDSSQEESIKRQLRERFANSKAFIVLIGENTWRLTKFVKWEIETAVRLELPIIAVNLNGQRKIDGRCPPALKNALAIYIPFNEKIITYSLRNWPSSDAGFRRSGDTGPFHYREDIYTQLNL